MDLEKKCLFYQNWEDFNVGRGIRYCILDGNQPTCEGDIHFCETLDLLKGYSFVQKRRKEWKKRRNVHSLGSQKF